MAKKEEAGKVIYKAFKQEPSEEQIAEMRRIFGEGTTVVDLPSGKEYKL